MKRFGDLFDSAFSLDNLYAAYLDARKGKRKKFACLNFEKNLGGNLLDLRKKLHSGLYHPMPYQKFMVHEPKERVIHAPAFRDIVVQHAVYRVVYGIFNRTFVKESFACRRGFGTHRASNHTVRALRAYSSDLYTLKLDVRKFFYTIDRSILKHLIQKKIKDCKLVDVMMLFAEMDGPTGIPIGNLLSQLYALIYLNPIDHYIKRDLRIVYYVRYVDDFILFGLTRRQCLAYRENIVSFLRNTLGLTLSKSSIQKISKGVNFVGYRTWKTRRFLRKYSLFKFKRAVVSGDIKAISSLFGHAKMTDSLPYMIDIIRRYSSATVCLPKKGWANAAMRIG